MHTSILGRMPLYFDWYFTDFFSQESSWQSWSIGSGNGLVQSGNKPLPIDKDPGHYMALPGHIELTLIEHGPSILSHYLQCHVVSLGYSELRLTHCGLGGGWGCEVSCGGHHRPRGKTTTGSALDGAVCDIAQILAYLVHNMSRSQLYLGFGHFGWLSSFFDQ